MKIRFTINALCGAAALTMMASPVQAEEITRVPFRFPVGIATSTSVPATMKFHYISGSLPTIDPDAPGDTESQTRNVISKIVANLKVLGLTPDDVVKANVYLVGDPAKGGELDFAGFSRAWQETWPGTKNELPARTTLRVAGLVLEGALLEVEVIAAAAN